MPEMTQDNPHTIRLADYAPPDFLIDTVDLDVNFQNGEAHVTARLALRRNPAAKTPDAALVLDGVEL